jgi:hypothetical protein
LKAANCILADLKRRKLKKNNFIFNFGRFESRLESRFESSQLHFGRVETTQTKKKTILFLILADFGRFESRFESSQLHFGRFETTQTKNINFILIYRFEC